MSNGANPNPPVVDPPAAGGQGGASGGGGTGPGAGDPPPTQTPPAQPDAVPYASHRQLLDEKKKVQAELEALKARDAERERKEAEARGDFQKLLEQERERSAKLDAELKATRDQEKGRRKLAAILDNAGGHVDRKWYQTLASAGIIDQVIIDPDTGLVDQGSVTKAVEKLKTTFPEMVQQRGGPRTSNANPAAGGQSTGTIRYSEYLKLPSREMAKWKQDQIIDD